MMRLLRWSENGEISFANKLSGKDKIPPYAILSHTWGADTEEVTFEDFTNGRGKDRPGYEKIRLCGEQARRDGLQYFWVDTCCIDKENIAELNQAINSMFRWYRDAARCYVYLSDVYSSDASSPPYDATELSSPPWWISKFRKSRWFTRGWTLQELLAPGLVEFFSQKWEKLGDKLSLEQHVYEVTGIPNSVLQGAPLSQFSINERLSWSKHRETTREEDRAYSLLGIFDVYISPFYGEGAGGAFKRLMEEIEKLSKCIEDLRLTDPRDDKKRIQDTKGGLLKDSYRWILGCGDFQQWRDKKQSRLLWIKGDPGKGKTMLLCGIADELEKSKTKADLLGYFFCQATDSRINNATAVLRGLLYMLVDQQPSLVSHIRKKHDHAGKTLFEDSNTWVAVSEIFTDILQDPDLNSTYLLIDALDECMVDLPRLLKFIAEQSSTSSRVKWIVSSRNWPNIEEGLEQAGHKVKLSLELNAESVSAAVNIFIKHKVSQLTQSKGYDSKLQAAVLGHLMSNANDTFLWVALACQGLQKISRWKVLKNLKAFPPGLDSLYERMMQQIDSSDDANLCKQILATVAIVYRPITVHELTSLIETLEEVADDQESLHEIIGLCGSFLTIRDGTIYFVHQSAEDYLRIKAYNDIFPSGEKEAHHVAFLRSLHIMSNTLQRNLSGSHGCPIDRVQQLNLNPLVASHYSCIYWIDHLSKWDPNSSAALEAGEIVDSFLRKKYLYWLEALSLCKSMSVGVISMAKLESLLQGKVDSPELVRLVQDARRFIMYHKTGIESSPQQAYTSALLFSPIDSQIRSLFKHEEPKSIMVRPDVRGNWSACLQTVEGHSDKVLSVAFSHASTMLVSASADKTVKIWDASSGECLQTLEGHRDKVWSAAFSHDSARVASTSYDRTIKIWDTSNGECLQTLKGHRGRVWSVAFSHDSTRLASASDDYNIKIWHTNSGKCLKTLAGHSNRVWSVVFSHNSAKLASASDDSDVKIWDASSGECLQTLEAHSSSVLSVAFSHDSTKLASAADNRSIRIWDSSSGNCLQVLRGHSGSIWSVAFSHDSTRLASASYDSTVKIWDASSGECLRTLKGHSDIVLSVAFSSDSTRLASASSDRTVKIWDASSEYLQTLDGHSDAVWSVAFSHNSTRLVSTSEDSTIKIWDTSSGDCLQTLRGHTSSVLSAAFSHDLTKLASASDDTTIKLWDASSGECLQTLKGHSDCVISVAFSHDSTRLASASDIGTINIWDTNSGECLQSRWAHTKRIWSVVFSHDSTMLASGSDDFTVNIWDVSSGECLRTLKGHNDNVLSVTFSHDSTRLASASDDCTVKIWDANSGLCFYTFQIGKPLYRLSFDNNSCLHTEIGTIEMSALLSLKLPSINAQPQSPRYKGLAISTDGAWITHDSKNLLWLPSEYRPLRSVVLGNMIGLGVGTGRVWICKVESSIS